MDPVSALSIAASVVQFVDFGKHLLSASYEIYRSPSGESAKEVELSTIAKDLAHFVAGIKDNLKTSASHNRHKSAAQNHLEIVSEQCEKILADFKKAFDGVERLNKQRESRGMPQMSRLKMARGAILKALLSYWDASKVQRMIGWLEQTKGRLITATLVCLW